MVENKILKVIIADDEPDAVLLLRSLLLQIGNVEIVAEAGNAEDAFFQILDNLPDLVLLDIHLPRNSGIDLAVLLRRRMVDVPVVFISAYKEFALQAIRNGVYDFLLKPIAFEDLKGIIGKYRRVNHSSFSGRLADMVYSIPEEVKIRINSRYSYILVNPSEIVYCRSHDGYTYIYLANGKKEVASSSLKQMELLVERWNFFRLGRSLLINQEYIRYIDKSANKCVLKSDSYQWELHSSRSAIKDLLASNFYYA